MVFNLILVFQIILFGKPSSKPLLASAYSPMQYEYWPWVQECCAPWRREGPHGANALLSAVHNLAQNFMLKLLLFPNVLK